MNIIAFFKKKFYLGKAPKNAPDGSIILFPYNPNILRCGLACILEVVKKQASNAFDLETLYNNLPDFSIWNNETVDSIEKYTLLQNDQEFCEFLQDKTKQEWFHKISQLLQKIITQQEQTWAWNEQQNAILVRLRDIDWRINKEHFTNLEKIQELLQEPLESLPYSVLLSYRRLNSLLNMIDKLEIRGRDSAGFVATIQLDDVHYKILEKEWKEKNLWSAYENRLLLQDLITQSIRHEEQNNIHIFHFIFKVCSEIGKLGDNVRRLRELIKQDVLFKNAIFQSTAPIVVLAHTRWASNGIINIYNCHPLDNAYFHDTTEKVTTLYHNPYYSGDIHIFSVLNGDIDNYETLKKRIEQNNIHVSDKITTDAKIISLTVQENIAHGFNVADAFRSAVQTFQGSHAISMTTNLEPNKVYLALHGSGQAIYVGIAPERYIVASEVYGIIEDTEEYLCMDGETPRIPNQPDTQGQIYILDNSKHGLDGITALYYDGTPIALTPEKIHRAEIKTRDIDRQDYPYFFEKEISQAPSSVLNTIRGKFNEQTYKIEVDKILATCLINALKENKIRRIYVIGQGTASIAAQAVAYRMAMTLPDLAIHATKSSELSGFFLSSDMHDTLVIAITQSGTTTDTNRAVDMAKKRGAHTLAIVNRRNSHITHMVESVFYTSDGRDIEMSVASTKAFYAQVVAGEILTLALSQTLDAISIEQQKQRLQALQELPKHLETVLQQKSFIQTIAQQWPLKRMHWAVVGSGPNNIVAQEVRIKLSELCYKSIACDIVEDKKHIDLSSEPFILACTAGTPEAVRGDIIKDIAIFKAHNALPVVITDENEYRFDPYSVAVIRVPQVDEFSALILNTMAGHLFGYYTAQAINEQSRFFAMLRTTLVNQLTKNTADEVLWNPKIQNEIEHFMQDFYRRCKQQCFFSSLDPSICTEISLLLYHATGKALPQGFMQIFDQPGSSKYLVNTLIDRLHKATEELSRPIDAIKHQAKTVTVGTSRLETEYAPQGILYSILAQANISLQQLRSHTLHRITQIQPAIAEVYGYSLYQIYNLNAMKYPTDNSTIKLLQRQGIATTLPSRSSEHPVPLIGTKRTVATKNEIYIGLGLGDKRPILIIPIDIPLPNQTQQLLLHIKFADSLTPQQSINILQNKYDEIKNMVIESNKHWDDSYLSQILPEKLCSQSAETIASEIIANQSQNA